MREEGIGLEHHIGGPEIGRDAGHVDAVDQDPPGGGGLEARQHAQQRGLAAARSAQQREELALVDVQRDIVDRREIAEFLGDVLNLDIGLGLGIPPGLPLLGLGLGIRHPSHPPFVCRQAPRVRLPVVATVSPWDVWLVNLAAGVGGRCPVQAGEPRSLRRHGRRRPTIHEFACQGVDRCPALDWPYALCLKARRWARRARRVSGDHGGGGPLSPFSFLRAPPHQLRALRVKILAVASTRCSRSRLSGDRSQANIGSSVRQLWHGRARCLEAEAGSASTMTDARAPPQKQTPRRSGALPQVMRGRS